MSKQVMCPSCGASASRVIYYGLPMRFCIECSCMWGFWSYFVLWLPFNGWLFEYNGSYFAAVMEWLMTSRDDD